MDDDQQFCLRWNNHQSTLVSVFDNLLENGTLVDCTLFAEGKFLKAHKVVLSACSPYFESLLTQEYDKHPIFILKDVKFQELKAMMDYMYRGEVNISQDQLAALLKAAESLQIKGLSDSRSKENDTRKAAPPPAAAKTPPPAPTLPRVQGLTIEQRKTPKLSVNTDVIEESRSRDGSVSPVPRKRKKPRRRTSHDAIIDNHDASSSSESHSNPAAGALAHAQNIPCTTTTTTLPAVPLASTSKLTDVPDQLETKSEILTRQSVKQQQPPLQLLSAAAAAAAASSSSSLPQSSVSDSIPQVPIKEKLETHSELILEPKSEYIEEEMNEDSVEDLTLEDDDDVSQMEQEMDHARPGPSHGSTDGSQGFGGWHMSGNQAQDEVFLAAQEAVGAHRDSQGFPVFPGFPGFSGFSGFPANFFNEVFGFKFEEKCDVPRGRFRYPVFECNGEGRFPCPRCKNTYKRRTHLLRHLKFECGVERKFPCIYCGKRFKQNVHLQTHIKFVHKIFNIQL